MAFRKRHELVPQIVSGSAKCISVIKFEFQLQEHGQLNLMKSDIAYLSSILHLCVQSAVPWRRNIIMTNCIWCRLYYFWDGADIWKLSWWKTMASVFYKDTNLTADDRVTPGIKTSLLYWPFCLEYSNHGCSFMTSGTPKCLSRKHMATSALTLINHKHALQIKMNCRGIIDIYIYIANTVSDGWIIN